MLRDSWNVMRRGETEQALRQMRANYAERDGLSETMELGVAFLWLKDYEAAWKHFNEYNSRYPKYASGTYGMSGVAKWCLGKPNDAVEEWQVGLRCDYADVGQFQIPLLLFFASVITPKVFSMDRALELLSDRADQEGVSDWPFPLAEFILDRIDESSVRMHCLEERFADADLRQRATIMHHWSADFYVGLKQYSNSNRPHFRDSMRKVSTISWQDFDDCERLFLSKLWSEELYLARFEAERRREEKGT